MDHRRPSSGQALITLAGRRVFGPAEHDRRLARAWIREAGARAGDGDHEAAIVAHGRAIDAWPSCGPAWIGRGLARARLGDRVGAAADLRRGLELLPPRAPLAWAARGHLRRLARPATFPDGRARRASRAPSRPPGWSG